jgi:hypothetical protein
MCRGHDRLDLLGPSLDRRSAYELSGDLFFSGNLVRVMSKHDSLSREAGDA